MVTKLNQPAVAQTRSRISRWAVCVLMLMLCLPALASDPRPPTGWDIAYLTFSLTAITFFSISMVLLRAYVWLSYSVMAVLLIILMASVDGSLAYVTGQNATFVQLAPLYIGAVTAAYGFAQSAYLIDAQSRFGRLTPVLYGLSVASLLLIPLYWWSAHLVIAYAALNVLLLLMLLGTVLPPMSWPNVALPHRRLAAWPPALLLLLVLGMYLVDFAGADFSLQFRDRVNQLAVLAYLMYGMGFGVYYLYYQAQARQLAQQQIYQAELQAAQDALRLEKAEKQYQKALQLAQGQERQLREASHDIRQPIAALRRAAGELKSSLSGDSSEQLVQIVDYLDQLATSYLKANNHAHHPDYDEVARADNGDELIVSTLVTDTVVKLHQKQALQAGVELVVNDPGLHLRAQPLVLVRLLSNLLANALAHASATQIRIDVKQLAHAICFQVSDNGRGMNETQVREMIRAGAKGDDSSGTGLGLSIVNSYAEQHGWAFVLKSTPGEGTCAQLQVAGVT